jgi:hypothetical protein
VAVQVAEITLAALVYLQAVLVVVVLVRTVDTALQITQDNLLTAQLALVVVVVEVGMKYKTEVLLA